MTTQDALRQAVQTLEAVMHQPPVSDAHHRLIEVIGELLTDKREMSTRLRQKDVVIAELERRLAQHTNGPAATEPS